jgi:hypothetical protein
MRTKIEGITGNTLSIESTHERHVAGQDVETVCIWPCESRPENFGRTAFGQSLVAVDKYSARPLRRPARMEVTANHYVASATHCHPGTSAEVRK